jgi:hypothetical protein
LRRRGARGARWVEAGQHAAAVARGYHAVAIVGEDGHLAASVARSIASTIAPGRRVILADLVGAVPVLRELSSDPDPEGVEDSFDFGISLARVAHPTPVENFLLIPSASNSVEREEVFRSGRWTRLARQCRASGWLLLVAARSTAPGVTALVEQLDGAILVGRAEPQDGIRVIHRIEPPAETARFRVGRAPVIAGVVAVLLAAVAAAALWRVHVTTTEDQRPPATQGAVVRPDTALQLPGLIPVNPGDSAQAALFAIEMMSANTRAGANLELQRIRTDYPAATLKSVLIGEARATWYRIVAGAYGDARTADSLLRGARESGVVGETGGVVITAPYALLVDSAASATEAAAVVARYTELEAPAYALLQPDGQVLVYVGAFTRPEESIGFAGELAQAGMTPLLVYRTGRVF